MSLIIFILTFTLMGVLSIPTEQERANKEACIAESGVSADDVKNLDTIPDQGKAACFAKCMGQKTGVLDTNGKLDSVKFKELAGPEINNYENALAINRLIEKCSALSGSNECETAAKVLNCLVAAKEQK